jgi:FAD/FMN-containing dehydrogenase
MPDMLHPGDTEQEDVEEVPVDPGDFAVALTADDQVEADLLLAACEQAGIPAILRSARSGLVGTIASPVEGFSILVPTSDLDRAARILAEARAALEEDPEGAARAAEEEEERGGEG